MQDDWALEDWLLDAFQRIEQKRQEAPATLTSAERLCHAFARLDMETRNGGIAQYFGNAGMAGWEELRAASTACPIPAIKTILQDIARSIGDMPDPYSALLAASPEAEDRYEAHQAAAKRALRTLLQKDQKSLGA